MIINANKAGAGTIFICPKTNRVLLNFRAANKSHRLTWGLWGGMIEPDENPNECLFREISEEMGFLPKIEKLYPFDIFKSKDKNFVYYSYVCIVDEEFIPIINKESAGYAWINLGNWPKPMHYGARRSFCTKKATEKLSLILSQY